jgi:hypothetical protein
MQRGNTLSKCPPRAFIEASTNRVELQPKLRASFRVETLLE